MIEFAIAVGFYLVDSFVSFWRRAWRIALRPIDHFRSEPTRFVGFEKRLWSTDLGLSRQLLVAIQRSKWKRADQLPPPINWKGVRVVKDPFELALYPLLLWELQPLTIIEVGSLNGGSAIWLADMLQIMNIDGHIYSFDINMEQVEGKHPRATFKKGDATDLSSFDEEQLKSLPHPWLVIEDAHQNVFNVLRFFDAFLLSGDYLVVEDTLDWRKYLQLKRFVTESAGRYKVDTRYTDMFGYNVTWNINGYLKKI